MRFTLAVERRELPEIEVQLRKLGFSLQERLPLQTGVVFLSVLGTARMADRLRGLGLPGLLSVEAESTPELQ